MIRITALNIYPVKGCRGIAVDSARVAATGFEHDREWLITRADGRFMTQRENPRLALIETALVQMAGGEALRLRVPGGAELTVPSDRAGARDRSDVLERPLRGIRRRRGSSASSSRSYLGAPMRLVRFDARRKRPSNPQWTPGVEALNQFSDGFPWLLISEASLEDLNARLTHKLPMNRFRPNIVVSGLAPFGEDQLHDLTGDGVRLRRAKPCMRCIVTTTDQATGTRDGDEPLRTLAKFRFDRELKGVGFGQNMILIDGLGAQLRVGQELEASVCLGTRLGRPQQSLRVCTSRDSRRSPSLSQPKRSSPVCVVGDFVLHGRDVRRDATNHDAFPILAHQRLLRIEILLGLFDLCRRLRHRSLDLDRRFGVRIALCCHNSIASSHCASKLPAPGRSPRGRRSQARMPRRQLSQAVQSDTLRG